MDSALFFLHLPRFEHSSRCCWRNKPVINIHSNEALRYTLRYTVDVTPEELSFAHWKLERHEIDGVKEALRARVPAEQRALSNPFCLPEVSG